MKLNALTHQINKAQSLVRKLRLYGLALFAGEVRSGKTATYIIAAQKLASDDEILVITVKDAIPGIQKFTSTITVTNFHQVKNLTKTYKFVIIDECHKYITGYPKRSTMWNDIAKITHNAEYILMGSGTPTPESYAMLFNMLALSLESPWAEYVPKGNQTAYSRWHKVYGIQAKKMIGWDEKNNKAKWAIDWSQVNEPKVLNSISHLQVALTQTEAGHKHLATDKVHIIPLSDEQELMYKKINTYRMYELPDEYTILADTPAKLNSKKHQISGGFVKATDDLDESKSTVYELEDKPKVDYIKRHFNVYDTIILAHYVPEQEYLATIFPNVGSITKKSKGVDYSHLKNLVIYSMGFSAEIYEQVRGRQLNFMTRKEKVEVHFLLSGIDEDVYEAVAIDKKSFTSSWYKRSKL